MWVDDRQDPEKSTRAAARHLKDLYNQFGDWYLAMAAYNSGPGTVQAAVKRTGYADFWELYRRNVLPKETRNYVPIILAVTIMAKNPSQYGLDDVAMEQPADYDTVTITYPVDLRLVAECVNSTPGELQDLNPSLLRLTTPREGKFELHIARRNQRSVRNRDRPDSRRTCGCGGAITRFIPATRWPRWRATITPRPSRSPKPTISTGTELEADAKLVIPVAPGKHPRERHRDLRPPHHPLQSSLWRHGRNRRRELRRLAADAAPLERHSRRQPPADAKCWPCTCRSRPARTRPK